MHIKNKHLPIKLFSLILIWILVDFVLKGTGEFTIRVILTKISVLVISFTLLVINRNRLMSLWNNEGGGFNLAMFRIIFFGFFLFGFFIFGVKDLERAILSVVNLPEEAKVPLPFLGRLFQFVPVNEIYCKIGMFLFILSSLFAFIGYKTRWAILVFSLSALYIFGVPQLFGKVNHNHHIVWFPAILIFSGCGDFLSVDCFLKNKSLKACTQTRASLQYGRAISGIWILIGIIYFFPGLQKIWVSGLDWIFTDNFANIVYHKSLELTDFEPVFPIYRFPLIGSAMAASAVIFELGFIFVMANSKYRPLAVISGLLFHILCWLFLKIFFVVLVLSYVSFINWEKWLNIKTIESDGKVNFSNFKMLNGVLLFLLVGNSICGAFNINSWPLSIYPSFSSLQAIETEMLEFEKQNPDGSLKIIQLKTLHKFFPEERLRNLEINAIASYRKKDYSGIKNIVQGIVRKAEPLGKIKVYLVKIRWQDGKLIRVRNPRVILEVDQGH